MLGGSKAKEVSLEPSVFAAEVKPHLVHETVRAELNAARAATRGGKSRGLVAGRPLEAVAPEGHGPRPRRHDARAALDRAEGMAFPPGMRNFEVKVNRKARRAALARRPVEPRRERHARAARRLGLRGAVDAQGRRAPLRLRSERPTLVVATEDEEVLVKSFRNLEKVLVTVPAELEVVSLVWARSRARHRGGAPARPRARRASANGGGGVVSLHPNQVLLAPVVSEKSYSLITDRKYTFRVHEDAHKTQIRQAVEELFEVKVQSVNIVKVQSKPKRRGLTKGRRPGWKKAIVQLKRRPRDRDLRGSGRLMALKKYKPTSPGRRFMATSGFEEITKSEPEKSLLEPRPKKGGRNNRGRITTRHQGGGHKRRFRTIDFKRAKDGVPAKVAAIEYDPNRSARIALLHYADGAKSYILAPARLRVGAMVESGPNADIKPGNALPLANIPTGTLVHSVELKPGQGGRMARSAGSSIQLVAKDGDHGVLRLPSGELRRVLLTCRATVGQVGNTDHANQSSGKAGRSRWLGKRPTVRGSAMNPVDHPHGGGEGKSKGGRHPVTPWGVPTLGKRTRRKHKESDKLIVRGRRRGKERKR